MDVAQASLTGTLRIIAILVLVWVLLRLLRSRLGGSTAADRRSPRDGRAKGEVRIEHLREQGRGRGTDQGPVTDADYEEIN